MFWTYAVSVESGVILRDLFVIFNESQFKPQKIQSIKLNHFGTSTSDNALSLIVVESQ